MSIYQQLGSQLLKNQKISWEPVHCSGVDAEKGPKTPRGENRRERHLVKIENKNPTLVPSYTNANRNKR